MPLPAPRKKRRGSSLVQQERQLTAIAQPLGVESDEGATREFIGTVFHSPIVRTFVDLLSRGEYAAAGAAEELFTARGHGAGAAVGRALTEIASGLPGVQGRKETFTQVLEQSGWGTTTLSEAIPALEGTWVGNFGTRGAAGLAMGIAFDPLTWLTFGAPAVAKTVFKDGVRFLNESARLELATLSTGLRRGKYAGEFKAALDAADHVKLAGVERKIEAEAQDEFLKKFAQTNGDLPSSLTDPGGVKFMGRSLVGRDALRDMHSKTIDIFTALPGGKSIYEGTKSFSDALGGATSRLFSPFHALREMRQDARYEYAIKMHRDAVHSRAAVHGYLHKTLLDGNEKLQIAPKLRQRTIAAQKADEGFGAKFYSVVDNAPDPATGKQWTVADLSDPEKQLVKEWMTLAETTRATLVDHGIFTAQQLPKARLPHSYLNLDELSASHALAPAKLDQRISSDFFREKVFENYDEAVRTSREAKHNAQALNAAGKRVDIPAELQPNYDILDNFDKYINRYSNALAYNAWRTDAFATFGKELDSFESAADLFDLTATYKVSNADGAKIARFFTPGGRQVSPAGRVSFGELLDRYKGNRRSQEAAFMADAEKTLNSLSSPAGRRATINKILASVDNESQLNVVTRDLFPKYANDFPSRLHSEDEIASQSYGKLYGDQATMVKVQGALTGDRPYLLPRALYDDLTRVDRDMLRGEKSKELHGLIRAYDKVTNLARLGVYTAWIPSALRDAYNNVVLSMFDTGLAALDPRKYAHAVGVLSGRKGVMKTVTGEVWTYDELRAIADAMGARVPGRVFAEGLSTERGPVGRTVAAFADKRGNVENAARVQLWLTNIERGVSPREAARHVADFLFDYSEVSPMFRSIIRRAFFFPTFTMKNVPFWARELRRNPGLAINQLKPFKSRNDDRREMVSWQADQLRMRLDQDGRTLHVLSGIDMPITNLDTLWAGGFSKTGRKFMTMLAPVPKTALEQVTGTNLLTGRPLNRTQGQALGRLLDAAPVPAVVRNWLGYRKELDEAGRPTYSFDERAYGLLVRSWMFSRVVSATDRQYRDMLEGLDKSVLQSLLESAVVGIRYNEIDLDETAKKRLQTRVSQLRDALQRRGYRVKTPGELQ